MHLTRLLKRNNFRLRNDFFGRLPDDLVTSLTLNMEHRDPSRPMKKRGGNKFAHSNSIFKSINTEG